MRKNCWECKHKNVAFDKLRKVDDDMVLIDKASGFSGNFVGKCNNGFTDKMIEFMRKTGKIKGGSQETVDCFEASDLSKLLDESYNSIHKILDKMSDAVDKYNNKTKGS